MKAMLFVISLCLGLVSTTGCAGSKWWSQIGAGRTAGVDDLPAGSAPASRQGPVRPYKFRSFETWSGYSWYESGEQVYIQEIYLSDGTVKRSFVKYPYEYKGSYSRIVYYYAPTTDDPAGWKVARTIYGNPKPPSSLFKR